MTSWYPAMCVSNKVSGTKRSPFLHDYIKTLVEFKQETIEPSVLSSHFAFPCVHSFIASSSSEV